MLLYVMCIKCPLSNNIQRANIQMVIHMHGHAWQTGEVCAELTHFHDYPQKKNRLKPRNECVGVDGYCFQKVFEFANSWIHFFII